MASAPDLDQLHAENQEDARRRKRWDWLLSRVLDVNLNDWEDRFVADLLLKQNRQGEHFRLTEAQEEKLEEIANRG